MCSDSSQFLRSGDALIDIVRRNVLGFFLLGGGTYDWNVDSMRGVSCVTDFCSF